MGEAILSRGGGDEKKPAGWVADATLTEITSSRFTVEFDKSNITKDQDIYVRFVIVKPYYVLSANLCVRLYNSLESVTTLLQGYAFQNYSPSSMGGGSNPKVVAPSSGGGSVSGNTVTVYWNMNSGLENFSTGTILEAYVFNADKATEEAG